jgi:hypothetical protein
VQREARLPKTEAPVRLPRLAGATNPAAQPSPHRQRFLATVSTVIAIVLFAPLSEVKGESSTKSVIAPPSRTINLTAEQRFMIKEIVLKDLNVPKAPAGAPESIGDPVPSSVELHDMTPTLAEKVPQAKSHKFYLTAHAIVLVSASDRKVADVIKIADARK